MMRNVLITAALASCAAALMATGAVASDTQAMPAGAALTGRMTAWQYLVGSWHCDVKIAATQGEKATTDEGVVTYEVAPGNALHAHVTAKDYASDSYMGYVDAAKRYWLNTLDAYGNLSGETSVDAKVFAGSAQGGSGKTDIRDTLTHATPTTIRDLQEFKTGSAWQTASDSSCTRL